MVTKRRVTPFGPLGAAEVVAGLPRKHVPVVTHLGSMDESQKKSWSLEGPALSVSNSPESWRKIARLDGQPQHDLPGGTFLHASSLSSQQWDKVRAWGVQQGHISRGQGFQNVDWDDEYDAHVTSTYPTREEADREAYDDTFTRPVLTSTPEHAEARGMPGDDYALLKLSQATGKAGVWWTETDDPSLLSAPRGARNSDLGKSAPRGGLVR